MTETTDAVQRDIDLRDLAGIVADLERSLSAMLGSDWKRNFTKAVQIAERANLRAHKAKQKDGGK